MLHALLSSLGTVAEVAPGEGQIPEKSSPVREIGPPFLSARQPTCKRPCFACCKLQPNRKKPRTHTPATLGTESLCERKFVFVTPRESVGFVRRSTRGCNHNDASPSFPTSSVASSGCRGDFFPAVAISCWRRLFVSRKVRTIRMSAHLRRWLVLN